MTTKNWNTTIGREKSKAWVLKILPVVEQKNTYESGWLGGFADGEGHYHGGAAGGGGSWAISLHQASGAIIEYAKKLLDKEQYKTRTERRQRNGKYKEMTSLHINGGMAETFRFLMSCRPERLITNLLKGIEKKSIFTRNKQYVYVESMEYMGVQDVVALETDTHTFIAEGLASHNCNVWRSIIFSPDETAQQCDWPVNHADLVARKKYMLENKEKLLAGLQENPEWHDAKIAGYWIWAASCWIGSGMMRPNQIPYLAGDSGIHSKIPHLTRDSGIHSQRPHLTRDAGNSVYEWLNVLSKRLRYVKVVCGDWSRVCGGNWQDNNRPVGMFFDPPYATEGRDENIYDCESMTVAKDVEKWVLERGENPNYRIVVAGYDDEYKTLLDNGWAYEAWSAGGGYSRSNTRGAVNRHRERLFISPHCLTKEKEMLF